MAPFVVAIVLLFPGLAAAEQELLAQTSPPPAAAPAPAAASAPAAPGPAAAPAPAAPKPVYGSWAVLKGGWFGSQEDFGGETFDGSGEWELAVGTGRVFGVEIGVGWMKTSAGGLEVKTIPLLLTLRLGIPIAMVVPHLDLGGGLYFNEATIGDRTDDDVTAGWHAGLGCDVLLGRLLLGADARYMGIAPTFSTVGKITLDRYAFLLKAGVRF